MQEDPASYLARRLHAEHSLSNPPTEAEIERICRQRGVALRRRAGLAGRGYYMPWPYPLIVVPPGDTSRQTVHELFHHLLEDNAAHGVLYTAPHWQEQDPELMAQRFEHLLCGEPQ